METVLVRAPGAKSFLWRLLVAIGLPLIFMLIAGMMGCVAVKPYQREYLADRIMDFNADQSEDGVERHWMETREGSSGGLGGSGGGCACN
jgi:hypothetical protein